MHEMTNQEQIIWLAGLLEGEGCFFWRRLYKYKTSCQYSIAIAMTDEDVIKRAAAIMGIKNVRKSPRPRPHKDVFQIAIDGKGAIAIMKQVLPFMGQRRTARIEEILDRYANRVTVQVGIAASNRRRAKTRRCNKTAELFVVNA